MNGTWGYRSYDDKWKPTETLVRNLVDITSKGGNFLLNVGPTSEGLIPAPSVERLKEVGAWMKVNGEAIYGTSKSPLKTQPSWGRVTQKGKTLYLHVFNWPTDGKLSLENFSVNFKSAHLLANKAEVKWQRDEKSGTTTLQLPAKPLDAIDTVVVLTQ
jgi:alpha-L-fucosidase